MNAIDFCSISQKHLNNEKEAMRDIILRKENSFLTYQHGKDSESEDEIACRLPDLEKDDFAARRTRMNQTKPIVSLSQLLYGPYPRQEAEKSGGARHLPMGNTGEKSLEYKRCVCVCRNRKYSQANVICIKTPVSFFLPQLYVVGDAGNFDM